MKRRSRPFDQILAENSLQMNSKSYAKNRIKRELSTPYNPQQNGIAEWKNRTIMEAARAMLYDQDLPMHLWAEATRKMVYVQNCTREQDS